MADILGTNGNQMRVGANRFEGTVQQVEGALSQLEGVLHQTGQCWGSSDAVARQFAADYVPGRDDVLQGAHALAETIRSVSGAVRNTASLFDSVEESNVADAQA